MGDLNGFLRQWRWVLPLQLLSHKRLRQDCTGRHLRPRMPAYGRSTDVWHLPVTEKDEAHKDYENVVQEVGDCGDGKNGKNWKIVYEANGMALTAGYFCEADCEIAETARGVTESL